MYIEYQGFGSNAGPKCAHCGHQHSPLMMPGPVVIRRCEFCKLAFTVQLIRTAIGNSYSTFRIHEEPAAVAAELRAAGPELDQVDAQKGGN